jgi:DNA-directed RNA polymerase specialized sigma24 family protein
MGSSSTQIIRFDIEPSPKPKPKKTGTVFISLELWKTAPSLRPDTQFLAEACMAGDTDAMAIRDAWRLKADRATRLIEIPSAKLEELKSHYVIYSEGVSSYGRTSKELNRTGSATDIDNFVDKAMEAYCEDPIVGRDRLLKALYKFSCWKSFEYKQQSLRNLQRQEDHAQDFVIHALEGVEGGKYAGREQFHHWLNVVYVNFGINTLNKLSREKRRLCGLAEPDPEVENGKVDAGYHCADSLSLNLYSRAQKNAEIAEQKRDRVTSALEFLSPADQAYASFLSQGLNQKDAAAAMGESVVTSRKRQTRVEKALSESDEVAA